MIRWILAFLAIAAALAAGHLLIDEKGYVLIAFNNTTVEGTVVAFLIMSLLILAGIILFIKLLRYVLGMAGKTSGFWRNKKALKAQQVWQQGLWASINDDANAVESVLAKNPVPTEYQDLQSALLAKAAIQNNQQAQALAHLQGMSESAQAQVPKLWLDANQNEQALALLDAPMAQKKPSQAAITSYLEGLLQAKKYAQIPDAIKQYYKQLDWNEAQWQAFVARWFDADAARASAAFDALPKPLKQTCESLYLQANAKLGQWDMLLPILQKWLKKGQFQAFADVMAHAQKPAPKLRVALQDALKKHPEQPQLLFAMGCMANAAGEYELAAKVFDNCQLTECDAEHLNAPLQSYEQTGQFKKAYLLVAKK